MGKRRSKPRFKTGDRVWVSPGPDSDHLLEDEGIITDVMDIGYIVFQVDEPIESHGTGWYAQDDEVSKL